MQTRAPIIVKGAKGTKTVHLKNFHSRKTTTCLMICEKNHIYLHIGKTGGYQICSR